MPHVLCLRPVHPEAITLLRETAGVTVEILEDPSPAGLREPAAQAALSKAAAVIVRATKIDREFLALAPNLQIVARHGVGYDQVDVAALTERGIPLTVTPDANAASVAEHALMLMLATARRVQDYDERARALNWGQQADLPTVDLGGRTVLVLGFGRIGGRVARLCKAFDMRVLVHDPYVPGNTIKGAGFWPAPDLHAGLGEADVVTLHCPSNPETRDLVDARFLAATKRGALLVNTARGTLVNEAALTAALGSGQLAAAGLDVFHTEPVTERLPLFDLPNVVVTPHVAAGTAEGMRRMALSCADSILACFDARLDPDVVINREVLRRNA